MNEDGAVGTAPLGGIAELVGIAELDEGAGMFRPPGEKAKGVGRLREGSDSDAEEEESLESEELLPAGSGRLMLGKAPLG